MSRLFQQAITITGNQAVDYDRLEAIGATIRDIVVREGGDPASIHLQRLVGLEPASISIDVFYEFDFTSPDEGFRFKGQQNFTVHSDNPLVAIYKRQALLGQDLNETLRGIHNMATRVLDGSYLAPRPAEYISQTIEQALRTFPNTSAR